MQLSKTIVAVLFLLFGAYFFLMRFDIVERLFRRGFFLDEVGDLILPIVLLLVGASLFFVKVGPKKP